MDVYSILLLLGIISWVVGTVVVTVRDGYRATPDDPAALQNVGVDAGSELCGGRRPVGRPRHPRGDLGTARDLELRQNVFDVRRRSLW